MLNNEYRFIGTIVSEYQSIGSEEFPKYQLMVEVEKRKKGTPATFPLIVYGKNSYVDVNTSIKGKQAIITGYIDEYKGKINLILQDLIVVGEVPVKDVAPLGEIDLPEDDLPF